jgi:hypothetical protein
MDVITVDDLHHQFLISGNALWTHPSLPKNQLCDSTGNDIGCVLGWPINDAGRVVQGPMQVPGPLVAASIEQFIYRFGGRWAAFVRIPDLNRLYLDPGGTLSVVYSAGRRRVGSTVAALVLDESGHRLWSVPVHAFPNDRSDQYWPAGTTLDPTIQRLMPNHCLDLSTWQAMRHYPKEVDPIPDADVSQAVERIVRVVQRQIGAVLNVTKRLYMPLTAGRDSRVLLACSRPWREQIDYVTFDYTPWRQRRNERVDLYVARRFAQQHRLRHTVAPIASDLPMELQRRYLHRTGFSGGNGKAWDFDAACRTHLDLSSGWLTGFAGEVGRAFYWRPGDRDTYRMSPAELLARLRLPTAPRLEEAIGLWRASLPEDLPLTTLLGYAYLEQRLGCWAAPHSYGTAPFAVNLTPFCHREVFELMLRLPATYRQRKTLAEDIIRETWPELLRLPFNEYPWQRRLADPPGLLGRVKRRAHSLLTAHRNEERHLRGRS